MGQCRYCNKKGFFLSVDENGLCRSCGQRVYHDVKPRVRVLTESMKLAEEGKTLKTRLSRCDLVLEHARYLLSYEQKGIGTISPKPSEILAEYSQYRNTAILEEAKKAAEKAISTGEAAATMKSNISAIARGQQKVEEILTESENQGLGRDILTDLSTRILQAKLDGFTEAARKAKFKGKNKKAIDQYQEVLFLIQEEGLSERMSDQVTAMEEEIALLQDEA